MKKTLATAVAAGVVAMVVAMPQALADDRVCRGTIGAATTDNIVVPQGATCTLSGTKVEGNVKVKNGAKLYAKGVRVDGNIQSEGFSVVQVSQRSSVGGDIQLDKGLRGGSAFVGGSTIDGNLQLKENYASITAQNNTIRGNLQAESNRGGLVFKNNRISGSFQCKQNNPAPTGGGNTAGDKEGQCSRL
ncbi:Hypothetical Protein RradSPS_2302 [Rubrobacter radiotolerans]|uniref:Polymer-forming cytoskeletal n=1 Tax=Rubrobacter radiotolerans TaxID=42256 RepID=A0A023X6H5_RUBRA|nr:hypothetical protein [Rubrobacter radiotolerans]AHY47585.1 Hypothetical Protein RradSPS_2302 [Rubrobacter radiotolerans]MDX5894990.1 hypothetical protein [Rubrobacter radiotolerans]SMC07222.1 conserved hypothetical protein [Rubrobacter radiotolerans DSM 5868]